MNDEIKEMLGDLKNKYCYVNDETILKFDEAKILLDYITNLQEENVNLKTKLRWKERIIDKAIECIEENAYCGVIEDENVVASKVLQYEEIDDLLNILKENK